MTSSYVRFWGVRGSYPAPYPTHMRVGGNTPCVEVRVDDTLVILDAGTGIIPLGNELVKQPGIRDLAIVLTHYHWDHISGLPFFVPAFLPGWRIDFHGPAHHPDTLARHIAEQMRAPYFPVETETWLADIAYHATGEEAIEVGPIRLQPFAVHHPGTTFGYRIEVRGRVLVYCPDNELAFINHSIDARKAEFDEDERRLLEEMKTEQQQLGTEFMHGVDMLIHDAQYTPEDYLRKRGWGHSCYIDTVNSALDAGVGDLYLFSHDPNYDDAQLDELHRHAVAIIDERQTSMPCHIAREGMIVSLE
jgi:ribonuclease BN (tRNA processing enzyme)